MIVLGIDPGATGGFCFYDDTGIIRLGAFDHDGYNELVTTIGQVTPIGHAFLEKVGAMPGQGVTSMFSFGTAYGICQGILLSRWIPHTLVSPKEWGRVMHQGTKALEPKKRSLEAANRLFPLEKFLATEKCRTAHIGMVEAALIANYGYRILKGKIA